MKTVMTMMTIMTMTLREHLDRVIQKIWLLAGISCWVLFSLAFLITASFLKLLTMQAGSWASPTHPLGCGSCRARSISGRKDPANIVLLRSTKDRAAGSTLMRPVMIAATWALTTSPPCPCREQQQLMDNGHGMKVSSRPNALLVDV